MAIEKSPYEGIHDNRLSGYNCLGIIKEVDAANRLCRVKTVGLKGHTDDLDLKNVQWISLSASTTNEGQEDCTIPTIGQIGVVTFINSEPYIMGYYRPIRSPNEKGQVDDIPNPAIEEEELLSGDRLIRTVAGNRIILRSGGTIQIESNKLCRTYWLPTGRTMASLCGDYKLETDGGSQYWIREDDTGATSINTLVWDNLSPTNAIYTQQGMATEAGAVHRVTAGPLDENLEIPTPTFDETLDPAGKLFTKLALSETKQIGADGAAYTTTIDSELKQATFATPGGHFVSFDDTDDGSYITVTHKTGSSISIAKSGEITVKTGDGSQIITVTDGKVTVAASATVTITAPKMEIKAADIDLGDSPANHAVIYEMLKSIFDKHMHPTVMGPSGPPMAPNTLAMAEASPGTSAKSAHIKVMGN